MSKRYHLPIEGIPKGDLFLSKMVYTKGKGMDLGAGRPPRVKPC